MKIAKSSFGSISKTRAIQPNRWFWRKFRNFGNVARSRRQNGVVVSYCNLTTPDSLPKHRSFIEFEFQIMRTTDSEIGSTFSQKSENQGFSSHYIDFRISPVWRRNSRPMRESSPNLISQLLLVIEIRIFENLLLCQMVTSSNTKTVFLLVLED